MPFIESIATALPEARYKNEDILTAAQSWLKGNDSEFALFKRFVGSAQTASRHFIRPLDKILELGGLQERSKLFEEFGVQLGTLSMERACQKANVDPGEIDTFIFTSCTCPVIPSIDALLIEQLKLNRTVTRIPLYQHGCAGGVIGLSLADRLSKAGSTVLLTSVEICSLGFQFNDVTPGNLVGSAIFGDGAASVVVKPGTGGFTFLDSQSVLTKNSRHLMGYDIYDDGFHLRLNKELPGFLAAEIPKLVPAFLERNGVNASDIAWWLFHPGGVKILDCLETAFSLRPEQSIWAREVLRDVGNLSSSSILFVASEFLSSKVSRAGDLALMLGVGPGLTVELILFRCDQTE